MAGSQLATSLFSGINFGLTKIKMHALIITFECSIWVRNGQLGTLSHLFLSQCIVTGLHDSSIVLIIIIIQLDSVLRWICHFQMMYLTHDSDMGLIVLKRYQC